MSTISYAALTSIRNDQARDNNHGQSVSTYVDAVAALVPAEVLALHAVILSATTETTDGITKITASGTLIGAFVGLVLLSIGLYVGYRLFKKVWDKWDWARMFIPPLSFVVWTMLQRSTAFDAVYPSLGDAPRTVVALFLTIILGVSATLLAYKANQK
jgi:hypothetical protein